MLPLPCPLQVGLFFVTYFISGCLGITLSYHRMLSHKSFQVPKWLEYPLAYCGVLAVQGERRHEERCRLAACGNGPEGRGPESPLRRAGGAG